MASIVHTIPQGINLPPKYELHDRPNVNVWLTNTAITSTLVFGTAFVGHLLGIETTGNNLIAVPMGIFGGLLGSLAVIALKPRAFISNDVATWLLTKDQLRSLLGKDDIFILYPPGEHPSYLWEERQAANNIIAKESSQDFSFTVKCPDGILNGKGSFRLRPNPKNPLGFLTSVAAASQDLVDLVIVQAVAFLGDTNVRDATQKLGALNTVLKNKFQTGLTDFEERFSLEVGDVTVSELLPTAETQRTISALTEAAVIKEGTAILLGLSLEKVTEKLSDGTMSKEAYERARRDFMSISGNFEGMTVERKEYAVEGLEGLKHLTPEAAAAIAALVSQLPGKQQGNNQKPKANTKGGQK